MSVLENENLFSDESEKQYLQEQKTEWGWQKRYIINSHSIQLIIKVHLSIFFNYVIFLADLHLN